MNKIIKYFVFGILSLVVFSSCEKKITTDIKSDIIYFPTFQLEGEPLIFADLGSDFTVPGCTATENDQNLEVTVSILSRINKLTAFDITVCDAFDFVYSAVNSEGYEGSTSRTVWVAQTGDLTTNIAGLYTSTVKRGTAAITSQYTDMQYILISPLGDNQYKISDALGGYYDIGRAYGYDYAAQGSIITATDIPGNVFTFTQATIPGFGNTVDISEMVVDAATKTITFTGTGNFANSVFYVTLTQVQF